MRDESNGGGIMLKEMKAYGHRQAGGRCEQTGQVYGEQVTYTGY
jgi:hypothetical protein